MGCITFKALQISFSEAPKYKLKLQFKPMSISVDVATIHPTVFIMLASVELICGGKSFILRRLGGRCSPLISAKASKFMSTSS